MLIYAVGDRDIDAPELIERLSRRLFENQTCFPMFLRQINDPGLAQYAYLIGCPRTGEALVIDPERDIDRYRALAEVNDLRIAAVAETHIHADFVSGAQEFAADPSVTLYLSGEGGEDWSYQSPRGRDKGLCEDCERIARARGHAH
jgi:glyoxylase-like metal-dependent hydrolase (beta-lactamase superfamily II)